MDAAGGVGGSGGGGGFVIPFPDGGLSAILGDSGILAGILDAGGFDVTAVLAIPQASYGASSPDDPGRRFLVERFATARDQVVGGGFIDGDEFDELLDALRHEQTPAQTVIEAHVAVVGRRR